MSENTELKKKILKEYKEFEERCRKVDDLTFRITNLDNFREIDPIKSRTLDNLRTVYSLRLEKTLKLIDDDVDKYIVMYNIEKQKENSNG